MFVLTDSALDGQEIAGVEIAGVEIAGVESAGGEGPCRHDFPVRQSARLRSRVTGLLLTLVFGLVGVGVLPAQDVPEPPAAPEAPDVADEEGGASEEEASEEEGASDDRSMVEILDRFERLLDRLEGDFDLEETSDGFELVPEDDRDDFTAIRIGAGRVTIDGERVDGEELARFVDDSAREMAELADLLTVIEAEGGLERAERLRDRERQKERRRSSRHKRTDTQVSFGSGMVIDVDESARDVVLIGGPLEVHGSVDGDATVVLGSAVVSGQIDGTLTVVGGSVSLDSGAEIDGDVVAVGGAVYRDDNVSIDGEVIQVDVGEAIDVGDVRIDLGDWDLDWPQFEIFGFSAWDLISRALKTVLVAMCLIMLAFLAPARTLRISNRSRLEPWKSLLVGLISLVLFPALLALVVALLTLSIVGIPLLLAVVPLMFVLLLLLYLLGITGTAHAWGNFVQERFGGSATNVIGLALLGLLLIDIWSYLGEVFSIFPWPFKIFALMFLAGGFSLKFIAWTTGLGAAVLEQFAPLPVAATVHETAGAAPSVVFDGDRQDYELPPTPPTPSGDASAYDDASESDDSGSGEGGDDDAQR